MKTIEPKIGQIWKFKYTEYTFDAELIEMNRDFSTCRLRVVSVFNDPYNRRPIGFVTTSNLFNLGQTGMNWSWTYVSKSKCKKCYEKA